MENEEMVEMYRRAAVANDPRNPSCVAEAMIWLASEVRVLRLALVAPKPPEGERLVLENVRDLIEDVASGTETPGGVEHTGDFRRLVLKWKKWLAEEGK